MGPLEKAIRDSADAMRRRAGVGGDASDTFNPFR